MSCARITLIAVIVACALPALAQEPVDPPGGGDGVRTLYLVRHGYYDHKDDADPDVGKALVPLGVAQARLVAARLRSLPIEFTALFSSTMTRARQTAFVIQESFPELEVQQTRILRECTPTTWREDIMAEVTSEEARVCEEQLELAFSEFFTPSPQRDRHDLLVCHGNVIRYLVTRALNVEPKAWLGMSIGNCSLTVVRIRADGAIKLLQYSDVGHLPITLQTGLYNSTEVLSIPGAPQ
jgi:serine/threonine-protein phosphatase PGAM5